MLLRLKEDPRIEDLRNHPADSVERLGTLLRTGVPARPDPRRLNFYEVDDCARVFYIHITPRGRVLLLAIWSKDNPEPDVQAARLAAASPALRKKPGPTAFDHRFHSASSNHLAASPPRPG